MCGWGKVRMKESKKKAILYAILAASLYAINVPFSKLLLVRLQPTMLAAMLYLGAGIGLSIIGIIRKKTGKAGIEQPLTASDVPYIVGMVVLDIAAPILLLLGLKFTSAANASLLNNFEIVATALVALLLFKESITKRQWIAIILVTIASMILSMGEIVSLRFSSGSAFVLLACICWGLENNCTRVLSKKDPLKIVVIKGVGSGLGSLMLAVWNGERSADYDYLAFALLLGFVAYGLSVYFYILAQRVLGAAITSTFYAVAPFIGTVLSLLIFGQRLTIIFCAAFAIMMIGTYFASSTGAIRGNRRREPGS